MIVAVVLISCVTQLPAGTTAEVALGVCGMVAMTAFFGFFEYVYFFSLKHLISGC